MATAIGTLGNIDTITVGGRVFTDLKTLITLIAYCTGTDNSTFRKPGAAAGYAVTTAKTLTINAVQTWADNAAGANIVLAQSDNDVGIDQSTAFTNPVYPIGSTGVLAPTSNTIGSASACAPNFPVAATKYFSMKNTVSATTTTYAYGYEA